MINSADRTTALLDRAPDSTSDRAPILLETSWWKAPRRLLRLLRNLPHSLALRRPWESGESPLVGREGT